MRPTGPSLIAVSGLLALSACESKTPTATPPPVESPASAPPAVAKPATTPAEPENTGACPKFIASEVISPGQMDRVYPQAYASDVTLPSASAWDWLSFGPVVIVSRQSVCVDGEAVARIVDGRIVSEDLQGHEIPALRTRIATLREAVAERARARGDEPVEGVVLFADVGTRQSTLIDLFYTANRAGFRTYFLALEGAPAKVPFATGVELEPPKYAPDGSVPYYRPQQTLHVDVESDSLTIDGDRKLPFGHTSSADSARLTELARERTRGEKYDHRTAPVAIVTAANDVTLERLVAVIAALAGPQCDFTARTDTDATRCAFPRTIIEAQ